MFGAYKPPFPWFGGKSKVASRVWQALGNVDNYVEPFFGSGAVLFARPTIGKAETVNDLDHWIANFWRAVQHDPEAVAHHADNPVNEDDLSARHIWLVKHGAPELAGRLPADPDYYNAKIAGWWVWGICCWIGSGWCSGTGPWTEKDGKLVHLGDAGQGVNRQLVHLGDAGRGVNRQLVHLGDAGRGEPETRPELIEYFQKIASRLKSVRVCSGDWTRVVTNGALAYGDTVGIFLDPPYSHDLRDTTVYNTDNPDVSGDVLKWCVQNGSNKRYRIALCGYESEHNDLERLGWFKVAWKANRAYGQADSETANSKNRRMERIWFSPNCLCQKSLLDALSTRED